MARKAKWLQYSLRAFLAFWVLVALWVGNLSRQAKQQAAAVAHIQRLGGGVMYDYQWAESRDYVVNKGLMQNAPPPGPDWLRELLGVQYFATVVWVGLDEDTCDDDLQYLAILPEVESIYLNYAQVTAAGLKHLEGLTKLRNVSLLFTAIPDSETDEIRKIYPACFFGVDDLDDDQFGQYMRDLAE